MNRVIKDITNFIFMEDTLKKCDIIFIAGGSRKELAIKAANLYQQGYAKYILPSGGPNKKLTNLQTEYQFLREVLIANGVNEEHILCEDKAQNTFDNANYSLEVLEENNFECKNAILISKTFHARRAFMTYKTVFKDDFEILIAPIVDERNITKNNWFRDQGKIKIVMNEVEKIGKYFSDHIGKY